MTTPYRNTHTCATCPRPVGDAALICWDCTQTAEEHLDVIVDLRGELDTALTSASRSDGGPSGHSDEQPLPGDLAAAALARRTDTLLTDTATTITRRRGQALPPGADMTGPTCPRGRCEHVTCATIRTRIKPGLPARQAALIVKNLPWLRHRNNARVFFAELAALARALPRVLGHQGERRYLGRCLLPLPDGSECDGEIRALDDAHTATCPGCGTPWNVPERRAWLQQATREHLVTLAEAARIMEHRSADVSIYTIKSRIRRGQLATHPGVNGGPRRVRLGDILDLAERTEAHRARQRPVLTLGAALWTHVHARTHRSRPPRSTTRATRFAATSARTSAAAMSGPNRSRRRRRP